MDNHKQLELTDSQKILVAAIVAAIRSEKQSGLLKIWLWFKKVLSFASSEADKFRID